MRDLVLTEGYDFEEQFLEFNTDLWMENTRFMEKLDEIAGNGNIFEESVLHENVFKSAWGHIKKLFTKAKEWIIKTWNKFWDWLTAFFRSNKSFVQKYKNDFLKQAKELDDDFEVEVNTVFIEGSLSNAATSVLDTSILEGDKRSLESGSNVKDRSEEIDKIVEEAKKKFDDATTTTVLHAEYIKEYAQTIIQTINDGEKAVKTLKTLKDEIVKEFKAFENSDLNISAGVKPTDENMKNFKGNVTKAISACSEVFTQAMTYLKKIIPACRKIVLKVITVGHNAKYKKNVEKESTMFDFNYEDNVDFIF